MRSSVAALLIAPAARRARPAQQPSPQYRDASPGYRYSFPRDHFSHPDFKTEWWYYTGNVKSSDGQRLRLPADVFPPGACSAATPTIRRGPSKISTWRTLALSDLSGGKFYHSERLNRAGPGIAGVSQESGRIWNGNWQVVWTGDRQTLDVIAEEWTLHLTLDSQKPPVIHGEQGISRKGAGCRAKLRTTFRSRVWPPPERLNSAGKPTRSKARPGWTTNSSPTNWRRNRPGGTGSACSSTIRRS